MIKRVKFRARCEVLTTIIMLFVCALSCVCGVCGIVSVSTAAGRIPGSYRDILTKAYTGNPITRKSELAVCVCAEGQNRFLFSLNNN